MRQRSYREADHRDDTDPETIQVDGEETGVMMLEGKFNLSK